MGGMQRIAAPRRSCRFTNRVQGCRTTQYGCAAQNEGAVIKRDLSGSLAGLTFALRVTSCPKVTDAAEEERETVAVD